MNTERLEKTIEQIFPWGGLFATRENFEYGYLTQEGRYYVAKYLPPASDVLVLGSGNGREARPIRRKCNRIVCLDIGLGYLLSGRMLFTMEKVSNVSFVQADVANPPFAKKCFDFIFFSFYSVVRDKRFDIMREIRQILRPDGILLLSNCTSEYVTKWRTGYDWALIDDVEQLRQEVSSCGFELLESAVDPKRAEYRCSVLKIK